MTRLGPRFYGVLLALLMTGMVHAASLRLPDADHIPLADSCSVLFDPLGQFSIADVQAPAMAASFALQRSTSFGYRKGVVWLRCAVQRQPWQAGNWLLEVQAPILNQATLYTQDEQGTFSGRSMGNTLPWALREIDYRNPLFQLQLPNTKSHVFYLQVSSNTTLTLLPVLWSWPGFFSASLKEQLAFGLFIAIHLLMLLSSLWLFLAIREGLYGWLTLYLLCNLLTTLTSEGYAYQYLLTDLPRANEWLMMLSLYFSVPAGGEFILEYIQLGRNRRPHWLRVFMWTCWTFSILAILLLMTFNQQWVRPLFQLWLLGSMGLISVLTIKQLLGGYREVWAIFLGMIPSWLAVVARSIRNIGYIPPGPVIDNAYFICMTFYLLTLQYAVSRRVRRLRDENTANREKALALARQAEHELETLVLQRTRELQQALLQVEAALALERKVQIEQQEFFATVSHELRTPLTVIDMTMQNMELDSSTVDTQTRQRYDKIVRATSRLTSILDRYLDEDCFAMLKRGPHFQPCQLHRLLEDTVQAATVLSKAHRFRLELQQLPTHFVCDADALMLVLRTLADNAVKYTPAQAEIVISGTLRENGLELLVSDNGPGMSPTTLQHVFQQQYRGPESTGKPGSGMGLLLARRLIENQGGSIGIHSTPQQGTHIRIWLPHHQAAAQTFPG